MTEAEKLTAGAEIRVDGPCPMPVLKTAKALRGMTPGEVLRVVCLDPVSVKDLKTFCEQTGNRLLKQEEDRAGETPLYVHWVSKR